MVILMQKEKMYNVEFKGKSYTVILMTDFTCNEISYEVYDDNEYDVIEESEIVEVINYLESQIN